MSMTDEMLRADIGVNTESSVSAVAWGPVLGGAFAALAMSFLLLTLGSGTGLSSMSPWSNLGISATSFTVGAAIWLIIVQWLSSGFGGYLTGRLRTKWANMHTDEVFFRDTAHGFLAWAVATVVSIALIASAATSVLGGAARSGKRGDSRGERCRTRGHTIGGGSFWLLRGFVVQGR
jgi:hypothetical protein